MKWPLVAALLCAASPALAVGLSEKVYGATVAAGVSEAEACYGRLTGGKADAADALVLELGHGVSRRFAAGALLEFEHELGKAREFEALGLREYPCWAAAKCLVSMWRSTANTSSSGIVPVRLRPSCCSSTVAARLAAA